MLQKRLFGPAVSGIIWWDTLACRQTGTLGKNMVLTNEILHSTLVIFTRKKKYTFIFLTVGFRGNNKKADYCIIASAETSALNLPLLICGKSVTAGSLITASSRGG